MWLIRWNMLYDWNNKIFTGGIIMFSKETITKALNEVTSRIKELEATNEKLQKENNQYREELTEQWKHSRNEIEGLDESLREANKKCTEYVKDISKLETENDELKHENADLNQRLMDSKEYSKRLNQNITKFRIQLNSYAGGIVVDNEDMKQTITKETVGELAARINKLEEENESLKKKLGLMG